MLLLLFTMFFAPPTVTARVTPNFCMAPCTVRATINVPRHPANRYVVVEIDGPIFHGSVLTLDGDGAPVTQYVEFKGLQEGEYVFQAVLFRVQGEAGRTKANVEVR